MTEDTKRLIKEERTSMIDITHISVTQQNQSFSLLAQCYQSMEGAQVLTTEEQPENVFNSGFGGITSDQQGALARRTA